MTITAEKQHSTVYPDDENGFSALSVFGMRPVLRFNEIYAVTFNPQFDGLQKKITHPNGVFCVEARYLNFYGVAGIELKFFLKDRAQTLRPLVVPLFLSTNDERAVSHYFLIQSLNEELDLRSNGNPMLEAISNESYRLASKAIEAIATEVKAQNDIDYFACNNLMPKGDFEALADYTCLLHKSFEFTNSPVNSFKVIIKDRKLSVLFTTLNELKTNEFLTTDYPIDAWSFQLPDCLPHFTPSLIVDLMKQSLCYDYVTFEWKDNFGDAKIEDFAQAVADILNMYYSYLNTMKFLYGKH